MEFYQTINSYYDYLFPPNRMQVEMVKSLVPKGRLIDAGCATGSLAISLSEVGYEVSAFDLDEGMVEIAKSKPHGEGVSFVAGNMLMMGEMYPHESFEAITCFGNTLVHLNNDEQMDKFFKSAYQVLKKGGKLLIQILNYQWILKKQLKELPLIENEQIRFERRYEYLPGGLIGFHTQLTVHGEQRVIQNEVELYPVTPEKLDYLLKKNHFVNVVYWGGFDRSEVSEGKLPLVISAEKGWE